MLRSYFYVFRARLHCQNIILNVPVILSWFSNNECIKIITDPYGYSVANNLYSV